MAESSTWLASPFARRKSKRSASPHNRDAEDYGGMCTWTNTARKEVRTMRTTDKHEPKPFGLQYLQKVDLPVRGAGDGDMENTDCCLTFMSDTVSQPGVDIGGFTCINGVDNPCGGA
jgi:hypothetical protein